MQVNPVILNGQVVRMEPLDEQHLDGLCEVGLDPALWEFAAGPVLTREKMKDYLQVALEEACEGRSLPFATVLQAEDRVVGCTRFGNIALNHRTLEIGWTWIGVDWQRTAVNSEAKLLLLQHAFESLGAHRVELKTDSRNQRSQNAIRRIGATYEGTFRKHMILNDGRRRDTVWFSITDEEWPEVRSRLQQRL